MEFQLWFKMFLKRNSVIEISICWTISTFSAFFKTTTNVFPPVQLLFNFSKKLGSIRNQAIKNNFHKDTWVIFLTKTQRLFVFDFVAPFVLELHLQLKTWDSRRILKTEMLSFLMKDKQNWFSIKKKLLKNIRNFWNL
jgi:hypothetical protein